MEIVLPPQCFSGFPKAVDSVLSPHTLSALFDFFIKPEMGGNYLTSAVACGMGERNVSNW